MIQTDGLTEIQIQKEVRLQVNAWLKSKGVPDWVKVRIVRGTYHIDNISNYFFASAAHIMKEVTGLNFDHMTDSMCRRKITL